MIRLISAFVTLCFYLPVWFFLVYQILVRVQATELMWLCFWIYVCAGFFVAIVAKFTKEESS
jgi:hypothetical protein